MRKSPENITACLIDETLVSVKDGTEQTRKCLATIFEYLFFFPGNSDCIPVRMMSSHAFCLDQVVVHLEEKESEGLLVSWTLCKQPSFSLSVSPRKLQRQVGASKNP